MTKNHIGNYWFVCTILEGDTYFGFYLKSLLFNQLSPSSSLMRTSHANASLAVLDIISKNWGTAVLMDSYTKDLWDPIQNGNYEWIT
jgi:hypothetical protein